MRKSIGDDGINTDDKEAIRKIRREIEQAETAGDAEAFGDRLADDQA